jgi:predicted dehydrogenase
VHLPNLRTLRETFAVVNMCDLSPQLAEQFGQEWGHSGKLSPDAETKLSHPWYGHDVDELLADPNVEAVLILTPGSHEDLARQAMLAGKHVLTEKPFAHTQAAAHELQQLATERGLALQVGYMKMYEPLLQPLREALSSLGDLRLARVTVLHPADEPQFDHVRYLRYSDADRTALADEQAREADHVRESIGPDAEPLRTLWANVLTGSVCHEFSLLRAVFGELPLSFGHASLGPAGTFGAGREPQVPPQLQASGQIGPIQLTLSWNWLPDYPEYTDELALFGSAGRAYLSLPAPYVLDSRGKLRIETADGVERVMTEHVSNHSTAFVHELEAFADSVRNGTPVLSDAAGSAWDVSGLQALTRAIATGLGMKLGGEAA